MSILDQIVIMVQAVGFILVVIGAAAVIGEEIKVYLEHN